MLLSEIFEQLTYGEFSEIAIGGKELGSIKVEDYPEMVVHMNLTLSVLHRRFQLRTGLVIIEQLTDTDTYDIKMINTVSNAGTVQYIKDTALKPFLNNVIKIERVLDSEGCEFYLNDDSETNSLFTPTQTSIQVAIPKDGVTMAVEYRANHPKIVAAGIDPGTTEIDVPYAYMEAITAYLAYRVWSSLPRLDGMNVGQEFLAKYELAAKILENQGINQDEKESTNHAGDSGWV